MVTALEPVVRACSGIWIAHGSGSADRAVVDRHDQIKVPPNDPAYTLRRVWLSKEQEEGYYYGFSNEGLWPLCHLAYVRPAFRDSDWKAYVEVNQRFAQVVAQEATSPDPVVLIQDFHFSLLPRLIRERTPKATIALFWAYPMAQRRNVRCVPVEERDAVAHARCRYSWLPHAVSLPELPGHRGPVRRVPDRP